MIRVLSLVFVSGCVFAAAPAAAHDFSLGGLRIEHPYSFPTTGASGAGYLTLVNEGDRPVTLLAARSDIAARVTLHDTIVDDAGVARMIEQERIEIAPDETVSFEPGGLHVMFMGLNGPLEVGDVIAADLVFDTGEVAVEFWTEERAHGAAEHHHHDHGG